MLICCKYVLSMYLSKYVSKYVLCMYLSKNVSKYVLSMYLSKNVSKYVLSMYLSKYVSKYYISRHIICMYYVSHSPKLFIEKSHKKYHNVRNGYRYFIKYHRN